MMGPNPPGLAGPPDGGAAAAQTRDWKRLKTPMKNRRVFIILLLATSWGWAGAQAQGLLGEHYFSAEGGWIRLENNDSDDGWGVGFEVNVPLSRALTRLPYGSAVNATFDYADVWDRTILDARGVFREYLQPEPGRAFSPYLGAGFGWVDFDSAESTYIPAEAGIEFRLGPIDFLPFYRYNFALDGSVDNFWAVGVNMVLWVPGDWGFRGSFTYSKYGDIDRTREFDTGFRARLGVIFAY